MCEVIYFKILIGARATTYSKCILSTSYRYDASIRYFLSLPLRIIMSPRRVFSEMDISAYANIDTHTHTHTHTHRVWYLTRQTDNLAPLRSYNDRYPRAQRVQQWCSARTGVYRPICGFMPAVCMRRSHFAAIMIERYLDQGRIYALSRGKRI